MGAKRRILWETYSRLIANLDMDHSYSRGELPAVVVYTMAERFHGHVISKAVYRVPSFLNG